MSAGSTKSRPLAYCPKGHLLARLTIEDGKPYIRYWVAVGGLTRRQGEPDDGHFNIGPQEVGVPLEDAQAGAREALCKHGHGGRYMLNLADFLTVIRGERPPLVLTY